MPLPFLGRTAVVKGAATSSSSMAGAIAGFPSVGLIRRLGDEGGICDPGGEGVIFPIFGEAEQKYDKDRR